MTLCYMTAAASLGIFPILLIYGAWSDLRRFQLSNRLNLWIAGLYFFAAPAADLPLETMAFSGGAALAVLGLGFVAFAMRAIGAGDVKFAAAIALWLGPGLIGQFLLLTAVFGGLLAVIFLTKIQVKRYRMHKNSISACDEDSVSQRLPYGVAIAVSGIFLFGTSGWAVRLSCVVPFFT